jgi:ABC-type glycerol-3-phosphate transport system substrate-binding protein
VRDPLALRDRRRLAAFVALLIVVIACAAPPAQNVVNRTLVVWVDTPVIGASIRQRIVPFMHDNPEIAVKVFDRAGLLKNGDISIAIEALQTSDVGVDVIAMTDRDFGLMSNKGDLLNLGPFMLQRSDFQSTDFFPAVLDAFRDHGKQYAIPSEVVPWMMFYNKQLFDRAHLDYPGTTWNDSEFLGAAGYLSSLTTSNSRDEMAGFVTDPTLALFPFIATFGVDPGATADDPFAKWLQDRRTVEAAQWFVDLGLRAKVMPYDENNRTVGLWFEGRAGLAAMYMDQREQVPPFMQRGEALTPTPSTPSPPAGWKFGWGVTMLPRAEVETSIYYASGYGIAQSTKDPDDAWLLIDYLTRHLPEQAGRAYVPARESLAYSPEFSLLYPEAGREAYVRSVLEGHRIPVWRAAASPTRDDLRGMLTGSVHPGNGLQAYRDRIQPLINAAPPATPTPIGYVAPAPAPG